MNSEINTKINNIKIGKVPEGYIKSDRFIYPKDWEYKILEEIAPLQRGYDLPSYEIQDGEYPICYSNGILKYHSSYKIKGPGVFTGRSGTIGKVFYVDKNYWPHNTSLWVTNFNNNFPKYIYYLYDSINLQNYSAGTGVPTLNRNDVHSIKLPIPINIKEQEKISEILSVEDKKIELKKKLLQEKRNQKKGLMERFLTGKVRLSGFDEEIKIYKLKNFIVEIKERNKDNTENRILSVTNKQGFILQEEQFERIVASNDLSKYKIVKNGQFAYNPSRINVGSIDLLKKFDSGILSPMYIIFECKNDLDSEYLYQFLKSNLFLKYIPRLLQGSVRDSLSFDALQQVKLFIPSLQEQKQIANLLKFADNEIELLQKEIELLKEQKKGLMQLLLTGIARVKCD